MKAAALGVAALVAAGAAGSAVAAKPTFKDKKCWSPLHWAMTVDQAETALKDVGITPRREETRAYFADPGAGVKHTSMPVLLFERHGWKGLVEFDAKERMRHIGFSLEEATEAAVTVELAAYEASYGPPAERADTPDGRRRQWRNDAAWLTLHAARRDDGKWTVSATWVPAPKKAK